MKEEEFNELMKEWGDEVEAIAGQPDPQAELTYGEMQAVQAKREAKAIGKEFRERETKSEPTMAKPYVKRVIDKAVENPIHYDVADTTVQEMIEKLFTHEELMGWLKGNIIKYRMRAFKKGNLGSQDIAKAAQYQGFYDEYVERNMA